MTSRPGAGSQVRGKPSTATEGTYKLAATILERALVGETGNQYADAIVVGGLDRLLDRLVRERRLRPGTLLARDVRDLAGIGYASLSSAGRSQWVATLLGLIEREKAADGATSPAARRVDGRREATAPPEAKPRPAARPKPTAVASNLTLESPAVALREVNRGAAGRLQNLGIDSIRDLIYHFPHRYDDFSRVRPIAELVPGEQQTLVATVWTAAERKLGPRRSSTELIVGDASGNMRVVFFNQPYLASKFHTGDSIVLSGRVGVYQHQRQMDSPEWELLDEHDLAQAVHTGRLVPVYPLTAGLAARSMRRIVRAALEACVSLLIDPLSPDLRLRQNLMPLQDAIWQTHYPGSDAEAAAARQRLAFDELLTLELAVLRERRARVGAGKAPALQLGEVTLAGFRAALPFTLTRAQQRVTHQILADLADTTPMARLLQGDVGSGKTAVAALALLGAVDSGFQGVLMAPTEILAEQHYRTLCRLFGAGAEFPGGTFETSLPYLRHPLRLALLHGGMAMREKTSAQQALAAGSVDIAVGTQALIQEGVAIPRLGLAVVDEQHRFGVLQRAALREKGGNSHLLVMTATPIPRTLALTVYGDLDVSVIDEMPPGRKQVVTRFVQPADRMNAYRFVRQELAAGRQAFVICPLVEESEKLEVRAAVEEFERLRAADIFSDCRIGLLHGRMKVMEKDAVMRDFRERNIDILVSTAVVEVGIDVPNASVILIEGADRFGLAQLHQFRGRVGRGADQAYCLLLADNPSTEAKERLRIMEQIQDGFELAEADLRLRGPGEYFGTRQSGVPDLRVARLSDVALLERARSEAGSILEVDGSLQSEALAGLRAEVERIQHRGGEVN